MINAYHRVGTYVHFFPLTFIFYFMVYEALVSSPKYMISFYFHNLLQCFSLASFYR